MACRHNGAPVGWLDGPVLSVGCLSNELRSELEKIDSMAAVVGVEVP
jgi:hypothetical protein